MRRPLVLTAAAVALATAAPGVADAAPSVTSEAGVVRPGGRYVLVGDGWSLAGECAPRVEVSQREHHGFRLGSAPIRDDGTFRFSRRVPRRATYGTRIVLDVSQYCKGVATSRTVRIRVGAARRVCPGPLSVDGNAYLVKVVGGLGCARGANAVGPFIDTRIEPAGWSCAHVDRRIAGHDFACIETERPGRRVTARRIREV